MIHDTRTLTLTEVRTLVSWAEGEGWNPGLRDAECFYASDPDGFHGRFHDGALAAGLGLVRYGADLAFLGLYICRPDLRGRGFGLAAWQTALRATPGRIIGLDGVPARLETYAGAGFAPAWRNVRYAGTGGGSRPSGLLDLAEVPFGVLSGYDRPLFGAPRDGFLRAWVSQPGAVGFCAVRDGGLVGWGLLRRCHEGRKIGPLFADDAGVGCALLDGLLAEAPGEPVFLDVPRPCADAVSAAAVRGMTPCFETARMYRGGAPQIDLRRVWGVSSFELG